MSADSNPTPTPATTYLRTQVLTASPEKLRLMLLDGAIRFTRQGRDGILAKDHEADLGSIPSCLGCLCWL